MAWEWVEIVKQFDAQGRFYHDILDRMPISIAIISGEGYISFANQVFSHSFCSSGVALNRTLIAGLLSKDKDGNEDKDRVKRVEALIFYALTFGNAVSEDLDIYILNQKNQFRVDMFTIKHWDVNAAPACVIVLESLEKRDEQLRAHFPKSEPPRATPITTLDKGVAKLRESEPPKETPFTTLGRGVFKLLETDAELNNMLQIKAREKEIDLGPLVLIHDASL